MGAPFMKRSLIIAVWVVAAIVGIAFYGVFLPSYPFKKVETQECSVCRVQLRTFISSISKKAVVQYQTNEFSVWYGQTIEPEHAHNWMLKGITTFNVYGARNGSASGEKCRFFSVDPMAEKEFLASHFNKSNIIEVAHKLHEDRVARLIDSSINLDQGQVLAVSNKVEIIRREIYEIEPSKRINAPSGP